MKLIGLCGRKGNGKDTFADFLCELSNQVVDREAFAYPLKKSAQELWGFSEQQLWGDLKEEVDERWGISPRKAMQQLGDFVRENVSETHFIDLMRDKLEGCKHQGLFIITDVRYENEAELIREFGGKLIEIFRPGIVSTDEHSSEQRIEKPDVVVYNEARLSDLKLVAKEILSRYQ